MTTDDTGERLTVGELRVLVGSDGQAVESITQSFAEPEASLLEVRTPDNLVEINHESLIRPWPRLRGWANSEARARSQFGHLAEQSKHWLGSGRPWGLVLRGNELAAARMWREATKTYREHPGALEAWVTRESGAAVDWAKPEGGLVNAVDELYQASIAAKWFRHSLWAILAILPFILIGGYLWFVVKIDQQRFS